MLSGHAREACRGSVGRDARFHLRQCCRGGRAPTGAWWPRPNEKLLAASADAVMADVMDNDPPLVAPFADRLEDGTMAYVAVTVVAAPCLGVDREMTTGDRPAVWVAQS